MSRRQYYWALFFKWNNSISMSILLVIIIPIGHVLTCPLVMGYSSS